MAQIKQMNNGRGDGTVINNKLLSQKIQLLIEFVITFTCEKCDKINDYFTLFQFKDQFQLIKNKLNLIIKYKKMSSFVSNSHLAFSFSNKKTSDLNQNHFIEATQKKYNAFEKNNPQMEERQTITPKKYQSRNSIRNNSSQYDRDLLRRLDQAQNKLIISQRNYGDLWKKYELSSQKNKNLNKQIARSQEKRLSDMLDLQNKFRLLQDQNQIHNQVLMTKENTIELLRQKLKQKTDKLIHAQKQIQTLNVKLTTLNYKNREDQVYRKKQSLNKFQSLTLATQLQQINRKNENQIQNLRNQLKKFEGIVLQKENQKKNILDDIDKVNANHKQQVVQMKRQFSKIQEQYKKWIQKSNQQKIQTIHSYERQLKQQRNVSFSKPSENNLNSQSLLKQQIKTLQNQNLHLGRQNKNNLKQIEQLKKRQKQWVFKLSALQNIQVQLKAEINNSNKSKNSLSQKIRKLQKQKNQQNIKFQQLSEQLQDLRKQFEKIFIANQQLNTKNLDIQSKNTNLIEQLIYVKKELSISKNSQLNMNKKLTQANRKLTEKILEMEQNQQNILKELYAQRLQNARLVQQNDEQKVSLRQQYELSVQNMKKQLSKQIQLTKRNNNTEKDQQKQGLYLQIRQLQRNYQLLMSQIVTVDDMMNIATKVHKRNSKFVKK